MNLFTCEVWDLQLSCKSRAWFFLGHHWFFSERCTASRVWSKIGQFQTRHSIPCATAGHAETTESRKQCPSLATEVGPLSPLRTGPSRSDSSTVSCVHSCDDENNEGAASVSSPLFLY